MSEASHDVLGVFITSHCKHQVNPSQKGLSISAMITLLLRPTLMLDMLGDKGNHKLTTKYSIFIGGNLVSFLERKHSSWCIALNLIRTPQLSVLV